MSKLKIAGIIALIAFAMGILSVGDAVAGEKFKWRAVWYTVKSESTNVPSEEGRIIQLNERKGILTVLQGSNVMDGMAGVNVGCVDTNAKMGTGFGHGEMLFTDRDGDKMYWAWESKREKGFSSGPATIVRGTGKFEGMKGKAIYSSFSVDPNLSYVDWEGEMELPR